MENDWTEQVATIWAREGGPAFPAKTSDVNFKGMSLRDWFAGQALVGFLSTEANEATEPESIAKWAYENADAMLAARKTGGNDV
jgi:hypothetical protein